MEIELKNIKGVTMRNLKIKLSALMIIVVLIATLAGFLGYKSGYSDGQENVKKMFKPEVMFFIELKQAKILDRFDFMMFSGGSFSADTIKYISTELEKILTGYKNSR